MIFVDTSAFVAFFLSNEKHHEKVDLLFRKFMDSGFMTNHDIINETLNWFSKKTNPNLTLKIAKNLLNAGTIKVLETTMEERLMALNFIDKFKDHQLSYTDAVSFAIINKLNIKKVFSIDSDFNLLKNVENIFYSA